MFEEFKLTNIEIQDNETLPDMVRIGSFERKTALIPAFLPFNSQNGFCFEVNSAKKEELHNQMQYIALSVLAQTSHELLKLTIIDIGIRTSFPFLQRLKTPNIQFVSNRIDLKEKLKEISDTARYLSTDCLGFDYDSLTAYNEEAEFKEPFNIIFISNFPKDFKDEDVDLVYLLITEAHKLGIYVVMSYDRSFFPQMNTFNQDRFANLFDIPKQMIHLDCSNTKPILNNFDVKVILDQFVKYPFVFESYTNNEVSQVIEKINAKESNVSADNSSNFISIPIGRSGRQNVLFEMGEKADTYHALIAGRTRTGKSTFLNNIITKIADLYSPDEIRLYLLDYKQGVEFQMYEHHPNVEVLMLDNSNYMFGVQQLEKLRDEITNRAKLFRQQGATINNINEYNKVADNKLPRLLLIIDEVQELFMAFETRKFVNPLVKQLAKQGAGFGIHMLFCSQSYVDCKIDDDTLSQMNLRIAFNLANGRECRAILGSDNTIPVKLEKYHAVYNAKNGDKDFNIVVKLNNFEKDKILDILEDANKRYRSCIPFKRNIILSSNNESKTDIKKQSTKIQGTQIRTVKRECKIKQNKDEYGF